MTPTKATFTVREIARIEGKSRQAIHQRIRNQKRPLVATKNSDGEYEITREAYESWLALPPIGPGRPAGSKKKRKK